MKPYKIIEGVPPKQRSGTAAIDIEMFGLDKRQLHRPKGKLACATICLDGKTVYYLEKESQVEKALANINGCRWVFHNGNFDIRHLRRWADIPPRDADHYWDTQYIEQIMYSGWFDSFALNDLSRRHLDNPMGKDTRQRFIKGDPIDDEMMLYAATDSQATWHIQKSQEGLIEESQFKIWKEIDMPAFWAILDFKGILIDQKKWKKLAEFNQSERERVAGELGFNPGSPQQTKVALEKSGIRVESTKEGFLLPYKDNDLVQQILYYRECAKRASTYGSDYLELVEEDGRLYPSFNLIGAETGRMSSDSPNIQQVPKEKIYRECFIADSKMVIADFSQQEMKIAGQLSKNPYLLEALMYEDVYTRMAQDMYHDPKITKKDPRRGRAKIVALGILYGLTPYGLAYREQITVGEAEHLFQLFFNRYAGMSQFIDSMKRTASKDWKARTIAGRVFHLNSNFKRWANNAVNSPHQGTGADMVKVALGILHKQYGSKLPLIAPVHDELLGETSKDKAKKLATDVQRAMTHAFELYCPDISSKSVVDIHIGRSWADK